MWLFLMNAQRPLSSNHKFSSFSSSFSPPLLLPSTSSQVSKLRSDCGDSVNKMEGMEYELARRQKKIDECETEIDRLVKKGDWHEAERRRLHNTIQVW